MTYSYTYSILSYFLLFGALGVSLYGQREIAYAGEDSVKRKKSFWQFLLLLIYLFCLYLNTGILLQMHLERLDGLIFLHWELLFR